MSLITTAARLAKDHAEKEAYIVNDNIITWGEFGHKVETYVQELERMTSSRLMLHFNSQSIDCIALLIATSKFNVETIIVSSYYPKERAIFFMKEFDADCLVMIENAKMQIVSNEQVNKNRDAQITEPGICLLTSGTTGTPKCVRHNWNSLSGIAKIDEKKSTNTDALSGALKISEKYLGRRWFLGYPVTHYAGMQIFLQSYLNGGCLVVPKDYTPAGSRQAIARYRVNYLNCTPTYIRQLLMTDSTEFGESLRHITLGGEIVDQQVLDLLKSKLPAVRITHVYGSSELGTVIAVKDGREGFDVNLLDDVKLKVIDDELHVKPTVRSMKGYLKSEEIGDRWLGTKDLVKTVGDRVIFLGRRDDVINIGGYKATPHMIENVIRTLEGVREVSVVGQKNPIAGNIVKAIVCANPGHDKAKIKANIISICKENLPYYMVPRLFEFVEKMKVTESQKLIRK